MPPKRTIAYTKNSLSAVRANALFRRDCGTQERRGLRSYDTGHPGTQSWIACALGSSDIRTPAPPDAPARRPVGDHWPRKEALAPGGGRRRRRPPNDWSAATPFPATRRFVLVSAHKPAAVQAGKGVADGTNGHQRRARAPGRDGAVLWRGLAGHGLSNGEGMKKIVAEVWQQGPGLCRRCRWRRCRQGAVRGSIGGTAAVVSASLNERPLSRPSLSAQLLSACPDVAACPSCSPCVTGACPSLRSWAAPWPRSACGAHPVEEIRTKRPLKHPQVPETASEARNRPVAGLCTSPSEVRGHLVLGPVLWTGIREGAACHQFAVALSPMR